MSDKEPFVLLKRAASGELDAQRALADLAFQLVADDQADPVPTLREGLMFARLAEINGDVTDLGRLIGMLAVAAQMDPDLEARWQYEGEAVARVSLAAEAGIELADQLFGNVVASVSPQSAVMAKDFERRLRIGE